MLRLLILSLVMVLVLSCGGDPAEDSANQQLTAESGIPEDSSGQEEEEPGSGSDTGGQAEDDDDAGSGDDDGDDSGSGGGTGNGNDDDSSGNEGDDYGDGNHDDGSDTLERVHWPVDTPARDLWATVEIEDASTLNATLVADAATPCPPDYICEDVRFASPHPITGGTTLSTAAWVVRPAAPEKPLAVLILMHGSGMGRDLEAAGDVVTLVEDGIAMGMGYFATTHDLAVISIDGPGEGDSNGPRLEDARSILLPDPRENWDWLFAYIGMRTITYAMEELGAEKVGMAGVSAGGNATLLANSIDSRLSAAVAMMASGHWLLGAGEENSWLEGLQLLTAEEQQALEGWIDPKAYLHIQNAPVRLISGAQDEFFPLRSLHRSYDDIPASKRSLLIMPEMDHWYFLPEGTRLDSYANHAGLEQMYVAQAGWNLKYLLGFYVDYTVIQLQLTPGGTPHSLSVSEEDGQLRVRAEVPPALLQLSPLDRVVQAYVSADRGWSFEALPLSQEGDTDIFSSLVPMGGAWTENDARVWFVRVDDEYEGITFDHRSSAPVYAESFRQHLRSCPDALMSLCAVP